MHKLVVGGIMLLLCTLGWSASGFGQEVAAPQGELRIVDKHPYNWAWIALNVFEHLIDFDKNGQLVPRLATSWRWLDDRTLEFTLRQGVTFHNGEGFDAEIVKLNWVENTRLRQPHIIGEFMNFKPGSRLEILDPYTIRAGQNQPLAYSQSSVLSRDRLEREALVSDQWRGPVGHGTISVDRWLLPTR